MAINLAKLADDLTHPDEDIRVLAMRTLCRLDMSSTTMSNLQLLKRIKTDLEARIQTETGETQFFAQKAYDHLKPSFGPDLDAPAPVSEPQLAAAKKPNVPPPSPLLAKDPATQLAALRQLASAPDPAQYGPLLDLVGQAADPKVLSGGIGLLGILGSETDLPTVQGFFLHDSPDVRASAVAAYVRLAPRAALLPALAPMLTDFEPKVSANVLAGLARADRDPVLRHVETMLGSPQTAGRLGAVLALAGISGDRSVDLLRRASRDPAPEVRLKVVQALEYHSHPQIPDLLARLAQDPDTAVRDKAAVSLRRRGTAVPAPTASKEVPDTVSRLKQIEAGKLSAARPEVLQALESSQDALVLSAALPALAAVGTAQDVQTLRKFLAHKNDRVRANAVEAVERLGKPDQIVALLAPLANDRNNRVRGNALKALGAFDAANVLQHVEHLLDSPDVEARATGLYVLASLRGVAVLPVLEKAAQDEEPEIRRRAAALLAPVPEAAAETCLLALATDTEAAVRDIARQALAARKARQPAPAPAPAKLAEPPPGPPEPPAKKAPAREEPDLPPRKPTKAAATVSVAAPAPSSGAIDFAQFDPDEEVGKPASALGREMDADARENAPSRLMLAPELQDVLEGLYEKLDEELEKMGRKIWKLMRSNLLSDVKLQVASRAVQKAEAALEQQQADEAKAGFLKGIFNRRENERKRAQIEFELADAYRRLGEAAAEQAQVAGKKHAGLEEFYPKVDSIFQEVRALKEGRS